MEEESSISVVLRGTVRGLPGLLRHGGYALQLYSMRTSSKEEIFKVNWKLNLLIFNGHTVPALYIMTLFLWKKKKGGMRRGRINNSALWYKLLFSSFIFTLS